MSTRKSNPFDWIDQELSSLKDRTLLRSRIEVKPLPDGKCERNGQALWNFAANDYLGLSGHSQVIASAGQALQEGAGSRASSLITGRTSWHARLETQLAEWKNSESALLFPTGFAANVGAITSLVGPDDVVFCDRLNHASLIDGARNSKAKFLVYPHCDVQSLHKELQKSSGYRRRLIITDSLFSMDGDLAPLHELTSLAEEFETMLLVDEAHSTGLFGSTGAGLVEEFGLSSRHIVSVGTLSKAIGAQGGFVTGTKSVCDFLWNRARTGMFSTALSPPLCAAASAAIEVIQAEPDCREWLQQKSHHVQADLREHDWNVLDAVRGPIIPVIVGDPQRTLELADALLREGILVAAIRPPTVPNGTSRLRISLSFSHQDEGIEALIKGFRKVSASAQRHDP